METSRSLEQILDGYGVLSAYGPYSRQQNEARHEQLFEQLRVFRYSPREVVNVYEGIPSPAWFIPNVALADLVALARKYEQTDALYCAPSGHPRLLKILGS